MPKFLLASHNADKVSEIEKIFAKEFAQVEFESGIDPGEVEEYGDTIEENARIKAYAWLEYNPDCIVLADDTGLFVDELDGRPGVHSARYASQDATYQDNCQKLLEELEDVPFKKRTARFSTCAIAIAAQKNDIVATGSIEGHILEAPRGDLGFGYDPLFVPSDYGNELSFAEMEQGVKNMISHRAKAFRSLAVGIKEARWV